MMDTAHRALLEGKFVYIISFDIAGAFDRVSHHQLTQTLDLFGVDVHTHRVVHNWIRNRFFRLKLRAPTGIYQGADTTIPSGLPQGGVLSPLLWLMFFNNVHTRLEELRGLQSAPRGTHHDYLFADDITTMIVSKAIEQVKTLSHRNVANVRTTLSEDFLTLQEAKTHNILMRPALLPQGVYRRGPPLSLLSTKRRLHRQYQHEATYDRTLLEFDPHEHSALTSREAIDAEGFPYPLEEFTKILGVLIDDRLTMDAHIGSLMTRAQLRQGILAKLARTSWGLETSVLRITHDALLTSLLRYGLVLVGSCCPDDLANRVDTAIINTAARKISGLPLSTRIEVLHFLAGTFSYRNLYVQHCATFLHQGLESHDSLTQQRLEKDLCAHFKIQQLSLTVQQLEFDIAATFLTDTSGVPISLLQNTKWM